MQTYTNNFLVKMTINLSELISFCSIAFFDIISWPTKISHRLGHFAEIWQESPSRKGQLYNYCYCNYVNAD